ncbi:hypothetical protein [Streptomyces sp. NPDC090080]|uniref:hypothetical protein n=1 Tax=Streptomyces sp. NPDC090080 TaxID=3365939 RepID=UPI00381C77A1
MTVHDQVALPVEMPRGPCKKTAHHLRVEGAGEDPKCIRPFVPTADIAFTENRFPVRPTTWGAPLASQVRPVTWSERIPTWSPERTSAPSAFALTQIAGQISSNHARTASGSCSTARLSDR